MATKNWESGARSDFQVTTFAYGGTWEADDLTRNQVGNRIKDVTAGSTVTATVVTNEVAGIDGLVDADFPEFAEFQLSANGTTLTATATTAGKPFTLTLTPLEANGGAADAQTIEGAGTATTGTTTVPNAGPNVFSTAANWSDGVVPGNTDTVHVQGNGVDDQDILYGLTWSGTLTELHVWQSFGATIGLPKWNQDGVTPYPEYRSEYLTGEATNVYVGEDDGPGSGRVKLSVGNSAATTLTVVNTGSGIDADVPALLWKGTNAANVVSVRGNSSVGIAFFGGELATVATLTVDGNATVICGIGVTLTTVNAYGGFLEVKSNFTTLNVRNGATVVVKGTAAISGNMTIDDGVVFWNGVGNIGGNVKIGARGLLDFSQGTGAVSVTNPIDSTSLSPVNDPDRRANGGTSLIVDFNGLEPISGFGTDVRISRSATA